MALEVKKVSSDGSVIDMTYLVQTATWAGEYRLCSRSMKLVLLSSVLDKRVPAVVLELDKKDMVQVSYGGELVFWGRVFERSRASGDPLYTATCYDLGYYLKRNQGLYSFRKATADAIAARVCRDFGISAGALAAPGVSLNRDFSGDTLYSIIQTGYTLSAQQNGKAYHIRFIGEKLNVLEKEPGAETLILRPKSNLMTASVTESITSMVNRVVIQDKNHKEVGVRSNQSNIDLYGLMQQVIAQQNGVDMGKKAERMLEDGDVQQKITVTALSRRELVTGNCVVVQEEVTGLYGLFWIDSDSHSFNKDGTKTCKLVLNYRRLMDEAEAGQYKEAS